MNGSLIQENENFEHISNGIIHAYNNTGNTKDNTYAVSCFYRNVKYTSNECIMNQKAKEKKESYLYALEEKIIYNGTSKTNNVRVVLVLDGEKINTIDIDYTKPNWLDEDGKKIGTSSLKTLPSETFTFKSVDSADTSTQYPIVFTYDKDGYSLTSNTVYALYKENQTYNLNQTDVTVYCNYINGELKTYNDKDLTSEFELYVIDSDNNIIEDNFIFDSWNGVQDNWVTNTPKYNDKNVYVSVTKNTNIGYRTATTFNMRSETYNLSCKIKVIQINGNCQYQMYTMQVYTLTNPLIVEAGRLTQIQLRILDDNVKFNTTEINLISKPNEISAGTKTSGKDEYSVSPSMFQEIKCLSYFSDVKYLKYEYECATIEIPIKHKVGYTFTTSSLTLINPQNLNVTTLNGYYRFKSDSSIPDATVSAGVIEVSWSYSKSNGFKIESVKQYNSSSLSDYTTLSIPFMLPNPCYVLSYNHTAEIVGGGSFNEIYYGSKNVNINAGQVTQIYPYENGTMVIQVYK